MKRYDPIAEYIGTGEYVGGMEEDPTGEYVRFDEAAALSEELAQARAAILSGGIREGELRARCSALEEALRNLLDWKVLEGYDDCGEVMDARKLLAESSPRKRLTVGEPTITDAIAELKRELAIREAMYPKWVKAGRMKQEDADRYVAQTKKALHFLIETHSTLWPESP